MRTFQQHRSEGEGGRHDGRRPEDGLVDGKRPEHADERPAQEKIQKQPRQRHVRDREAHAPDDGGAAADGDQEHVFITCRRVVNKSKK